MQLDELIKFDSKKRDQADALFQQLQSKPRLTPGEKFLKDADDQIYDRILKCYTHIKQAKTLMKELKDKTVCCLIGNPCSGKTTLAN